MYDLYAVCVAGFDRLIPRHLLSPEWFVGSRAHASVQYGRLPGCSISGPTSTTIKGIPHGKGERRIRPGHGQSPIPVHFDGNYTVGPSITHRWLPSFSKIRTRCGMQSTSAKTSNEIIRCLRFQLLSVSWLRSFHCRRINSPETRRFRQGSGQRLNRPSFRIESSECGRR